jgi:MoaA/NifB/PqqE/SkfB family radical SAM enzyme
VVSLGRAVPRRLAPLGAALRLSVEVARDAWLTHRPFLLYFKPTARCDCRCQICDRWQRPSRTRDELPLAEIVELLARFRKAGSAVLTLWGGEPLLREELPEILREAKALGYRTSLCTNGGRLAERAADVVPWLDVLLCSLDAHGERHDELRGVRGLFERAVRGIEAARRFESCDVKIWAVVHRKSREDVARLATLARELDVGIELFPLSAIAGHNDPLLLTGRERSEAFREIRELAERGYPIRNPRRALELMASGASYDCNFPRIAIHVDERGTLHSCEDPQGTPLRIWGDARDLDPVTLYRSEEYRRGIRELRGCQRCLLPCVAELSGSLPLALATMGRARAR